MILGGSKQTGANMTFEEMTPEQQDAWKKHQMYLAEQYQRRAERKAKQETTNKLLNDYHERFEMFPCLLDDECLRLMTLSLETGIDQLVDQKRRQREWEEKRAREHAEFLARPITPEMVAEYTKLIKRRKLYEGACELSWQKYFEYVTAHPEIVLTPEDREYTGQWTSCAIK
jgi:hypothetical protein